MQSEELTPGSVLPEAVADQRTPDSLLLLVEPEPERPQQPPPAKRNTPPTLDPKAVRLAEPEDERAGDRASSRGVVEE